jgi:hypothetical protein
VRREVDDSRQLERFHCRSVTLTKRDMLTNWPVVPDQRGLMDHTHAATAERMQ